MVDKDSFVCLYTLWLLSRRLSQKVHKLIFLYTALKPANFDIIWQSVYSHRRSHIEAKGDRTSYKPRDLSQCCLNCTNFGKLSLKKITKIAATRCHILKLKCTKFDRLGFRPRPQRGAYSAPPDPIAGFQGAYL